MLLLAIACFIAAFICGLAGLLMNSTQSAAAAQTLFGLFLLAGLVLFTVCVLAQNHGTGKSRKDD